MLFIWGVGVYSGEKNAKLNPKGKPLKCLYFLKNTKMRLMQQMAIVWQAQFYLRY